MQTVVPPAAFWSLVCNGWSLIYSSKAHIVGARDPEFTNTKVTNSRMNTPHIFLTVCILSVTRDTTPPGRTFKVPLLHAVGIVAVGAENGYVGTVSSRSLTNNPLDFEMTFGVGKYCCSRALEIGPGGAVSCVTHGITPAETTCTWYAYYGEGVVRSRAVSCAAPGWLCLINGWIHLLVAVML